MELNTLTISFFGLIGWGIAAFIYSKFKKTEEDNEKLNKQKEELRGMISKEFQDKYTDELSELKRYQTQYLVHMEERDKILSSLSSLLRK